ncbi:ABC transporter ATP-binding protein [Limosilactobacillus caviae]|uniref:ABC transporter ATP-binding protein n=1 Tax=Limosilactobacillus caviae TaxID=1769424 RepID=UPI00129BC492|nr:ABC transporter ATP-binding protein [Limosilactobacillus caviae]MCD7123640.1 ABC transporter ATP-binding protein [Limosilactobacillus caviae]MRH45714.1 ATP-binding cassette domain-containing protein [Limosilactobacillus reuteri]
MIVFDVHNLSFSYPKRQFVFHHVNFSLKTGEIFTILGPNGVGKSTLLHCLTGLLSPQQGTITVFGNEITALNGKNLAQQIAYVPQDYHINSNLTVIDYLLTGRAPYLSFFQTPKKKDFKMAEKYLQDFQLFQFRDHPFAALSGGQQQLITIIRALLQQPKLLILDEPMAALDLSRQYEILKLVKRLAHQEKITIILTTHLPDHALMLPTKIGLLDSNGTLTVGSRDQLMTTERLTEVYQVPLTLAYVPALQRYTCQIKL